MSVWIVTTTIPHESTRINGVCSSPGIAAALAIKCEQETAHFGDAVVRIQEWMVR